MFYSSALADADATEVAARIRRGELTPREAVEAALDRIARHNPELGAITIPLAARADRQLEQLSWGPFRGVPIVVKDIIAEIEDVPYTAGTRMLRQAGYKSRHSSFLVQKLERAGFVIVGKTNTSELGILPSAEPPAWPPSRNPYDLGRSTGGSSGGTAAAVAAGLVPIGHANDGGGSIRIPASCCGLFGLMPSRGRTSLGPTLGAARGGLVAEHVLTRSVRDSAALLDLLAGYEPGDPYAAPTPSQPFAQALTAAPRKLKVAMATRFIGPDGQMQDSHPDCVAAVRHTASLLRAAGHTVEEAEIEALREPDWVPRFLTIWAVGVATDLAEIGAIIGRPVRDDEVEPVTAALGALGAGVSAPTYAAAWHWIQQNARQVAAFWDRFDLWLTPTVTEPPLPLGTFAPSDDPLAPIFRAAAFAPFTAPFNATGQPACSLPLYRNAAGLPIGTQLVGAYGREDVLLAVSAQLEQAQPFVHAATRS